MMDLDWAVFYAPALLKFQRYYRRRIQYPLENYNPHWNRRNGCRRRNYWSTLDDVFSEGHSRP